MINDSPVSFKVGLQWTVLFTTYAALHAKIELYPDDGSMTGRYFHVYPVVMMATNKDSAFEIQIVRTRAQIPIFLRLLSNVTDDAYLQSGNIFTFPSSFQLNESSLVRSKLAYLYIEDINSKSVMAIARTKDYSTSFFGTYTPLSFSSLGTEYYVVTFCEFSGLCQFAVSWIPSKVHQNATVIEVVIIFPSNNPDLIVSLDNRNYSASEKVTLYLSYGETLQVQSKHDLTGTQIVSNYTTAVYSGSCDSKVHAKGRKGFMIEQLLPVSRLGKHFICYSYPRSANNSNFFRIVGVVRNITSVYINGTEYNRLDTGEWFDLEVESGSATYVLADQPISVVHFISGIQEDGNLFNPNMIQIQPLEGFQDWAIFRSKDETFIDAVIMGMNGDRVRYSSSPSSFDVFTYIYFTSLTTDMYAGLTSFTDRKRRFFRDTSGYKFGGYVRAEFTDMKVGESFLMMMEYPDLNITYESSLYELEENTSVVSSENTEAGDKNGNDCLCVCVSQDDQLNMTEIINQLRAELLVDKSTLSSTIRKKNSAKDMRPSAVGIGVVGAAILVFVAILLIIADFSHFARYLRHFCRTFKSFVHGDRHNF